MGSLPLSVVLFGLAALMLYLVLFWAGFKFKLLREFRVFYFVVGTYCAIDLSNWIVRLTVGFNSLGYYYNYYGTEILQVAANTVLPGVIFTQIRERNTTGSWLFAVAKTSALEWLL